MWSWIMSFLIIAVVAILVSFGFCYFYIPIRVGKSQHAGNEPAEN